MAESTSFCTAEVTVSATTCCVLDTESEHTLMLRGYPLSDLENDLEID